MAWEDHAFLNMLKATLTLLILILISSSEPVNANYTTKGNKRCFFLQDSIAHWDWSVVGEAVIFINVVLLTFGRRPSLMGLAVT